MDDPYRMLGVRRDASAADIRAAYRSAIRSAHPDAGGSQDRASRLNAAYAVLSDPQRRAEWDRRHPIGPPPASRPAAAPRPPSAPRAPATPPARRSSPGPAVVFMGVVAVVLVGILFATLQSGGPEAAPTASEDVDDDPFVVSVGDCVDLDPGVPTDVPCGGTRADGEVVAFGPTCPAGTELFPTEDGGLCLDRFPSFSPASCVSIDGQVVTPVECGPSPDGIVSAIVDDPDTCPLGVTGVANLGDGSFACIVIP